MANVRPLAHNALPSKLCALEVSPPSHWQIRFLTLHFLSPLNTCSTLILHLNSLGSLLSSDQQCCELAGLGCTHFQACRLTEIEL